MSASDLLQAVGVALQMRQTYLIHDKEFENEKKMHDVEIKQALDLHSIEAKKTRLLHREQIDLSKKTFLIDNFGEIARQVVELDAVCFFPFAVPSLHLFINHISLTLSPSLTISHKYFS